ncbi:sporulation protein YqfC [Tepidibacillus infernus]|uniref:Sporulation protein YqfC n=1 Tax=Tepidibacillus decaturensis TaxID=1413211 RepID=A0A135L2E5_9BACI|nr:MULTISPECIES: sporulation protein YqfC [Tepidibacillus]KXG43184.1 sporulation protein YqfC [Tepidibacillus decaturensis]GBF10143.1 yabP family protein [Tepidibacillus sp. HK-1]
MRKLRQKIKQLTANQLELPKDVIFDLPRITMIGSYQIYIENHRGVIQFTDQFLHLRLSKGELRLVGKQLVIRTILPEEVLVEGIINEIHYID